MSNESSTIVQKLWNFCDVLRYKVLRFMKICAKITIVWTILSCQDFRSGVKYGLSALLSII